MGIPVGTEEASRRLLQHRRLLYAYILAIVRDAQMAEDLFQEVSIVILRRWEELGSVRDFWALARAIARRQALAAIRQAGRNPTLVSPEPPAASAGAEADPGGQTAGPFSDDDRRGQARRRARRSRRPFGIGTPPGRRG